MIALESSHKGARFVQGNSKLGKTGKIWHWSIPAWDTCPGRSEKCSFCYARRGHFRQGNVQDRLSINYQASLSKGFVSWAVEEIQQRQLAIVRIHVAGDFYSASYARKWLRIIKATPDTTFFCYTRSWRLGKMQAVMEELARQDNLFLWYSVDTDTGLPARVPPGVRLAGMLVEGDEEELLPGADLYFRDGNFLKGEVIKSIDGQLVCPKEQGTKARVTCETCQLCFTDSNTCRRSNNYDLTPKPSTRVALELV